MEKEHRGFLYGLLAALFSAICAVFIKLAASVPNETMVCVRFIIALLFVLPGILLGRIHIRPKYFLKHMWRALTGLGAVYCFFYSIKYLPLVNAVTLSNTAPLFLPIIVFFWLKLVIPKSRVFALIIGFLGVIVIMRPEAGVEETTTFIALLGGLFSSITQIGIRQLSKSESTETIMAYYFIISAIVSLPPMIFSWQPIADPILWLYLLLIALSFLAFQYFIVKSLTHAPATKVSSMTYLGVVFSGLFGWWLFNEVPQWIQLAGIGLIVLGGVLALFSKASTRKRKGYG